MTEPSDNPRSLPWYLGAIVQGAVLGFFLSWAIAEWVLLVDGASVFRYQGF